MGMFYCIGNVTESAGLQESQSLSHRKPFPDFQSKDYIRRSAYCCIMLGQVVDMLDLTSVAIVLLILSLVYQWLTTPKNLPPGPISLPMVGNLLSLPVSGGGITKVLEKWYHTYGDVFTFRVGNARFVVLNSYEAIQEAFVKKGDIFSGRPSNMYIFKKLEEIAGTGIIFTDGQPWKELRRVTLITMRELGVGKKTLEERVREEARAVMDILDKGQGREILMKPLLAKFTSNIICSIIFGARFDYDDHTFIKLTSLIDEIVKESSFFAPVNFLPFLRCLPFTGTRQVNVMADNFHKVDNYLQTLLREHEETFNPEEIRDFIDLYIKTGRESENKHLFSAKNLRRTITDLFAAGTETTSTVLDWLILYMVQFPKIQTRCQHEIDKVIGQERMIEAEDRHKLPFIEAVLSEILRLVPVVPLGVPHASVKEGTIAGYTIPAESILVTNQRIVHCNPKVWPDPLTFKPERFLDEQGHFCAPKHHMIPFSIGPRTCLGEALARMELFILFTTLLQFYTFSMVNGHKPDLEGHYGVTYISRDQSVLATRR